MEEIAIKIEHVSKQYRLGTIGGGTLRGDLQSWMARVRGKEDPNLKLGQAGGYKGDRFMALEDVSFEVKKGEAVGIIGHNGAGKSTLLKLLSRVTAPTSGKISYNGRIASMLEVGTGFHPELTGRENVYMNGAILGMTKAEIDKKFDQIVEFAEMEKFIDTPVKRYSSGMYVKLAFSVAAHLDSEIMVMDEVLAVGDMKFQQKCLGRMGDAANQEGRTVLYVSHNMNTIRQLCTRCIVLDHGRVIFDGDTERAIDIYMGTVGAMQKTYTYPKSFHPLSKLQDDFVMEGLDIVTKEKEYFVAGDLIEFLLHCKTRKKWDSISFRFEIAYQDGTMVGTMFSSRAIQLPQNDDNILKMCIDTTHFTPGRYKVDIVAFLNNEFGTQQLVDAVYPAFVFDISDEMSENDKLVWMPQFWGHIHLHDVDVLEEK